MKLTASSVLVKYLAAAAPRAASATRRHSSAFLHLLFSFGLFGLFLVLSLFRIPRVLMFYTLIRLGWSSAGGG